MNRMQPIAFFVALGACLVGSGNIGHAKDKVAYQTAKLVDLRANKTGAGAGRAQYSYCLAIQSKDISYILTYETFFRGGYKPTNLIVGDPIEIRIKGDHLYFETGQKSSDDEAKAHIIRQERIAAGGKPATCGLPVEVQ
jgi:hypothetical protein